MITKLIVDGEDRRIRLVPENEADKKLLEFISEHDTARVITKRKDTHYYTEKKIEHIDVSLIPQKENVGRDEESADILRNGFSTQYTND